MKAMKKLGYATGPRRVFRRKTKITDPPSGGAGDWLRQMIIVRAQIRKK